MEIPRGLLHVFRQPKSDKNGLPLARVPYSGHVERKPMGAAHRSLVRAGQNGQEP